MLQSGGEWKSVTFAHHSLSVSRVGENYSMYLCNKNQQNAHFLQ